MRKKARFFRFLDECVSVFLKSTRTIWGIVVSLYAIFIYVIINSYLPGRVSADQFLYVYQPILWLSLANLAWLGWHYGLTDRPKPSLSLALTACLIGLCQIAVLAIAGLLLGFGYSPYSRQLHAVMLNILYLVTSLAGLEMTRAYLVTHYKQSRSWMYFVLVSLLLTMLRIPLATFGQFDNLQSSVLVIGERLLPTLAQNMLATLLALLGGPLPSIPLFGHSSVV